MDYTKLFGRGTKEIAALILTVGIVIRDIKLEIRIEKCPLINKEKGEVTKTKGIQLPDSNRRIKGINETGCKYLE